MKWIKWMLERISVLYKFKDIKSF